MKNIIIALITLFICVGCGSKIKEPCNGTCKNGKECSTNDDCKCPDDTYDISNACITKNNSYYSIDQCLCLDTIICAIGSPTGVGNRRAFILQTPSVELSSGYNSITTDCEYYEKADGDSLRVYGSFNACNTSNNGRLSADMLGKLSIDRKQIKVRILWRRGQFPFEVVDSCVKVFSRQ